MKKSILAVVGLCVAITVGACGPPGTTLPATTAPAATTPSTSTPSPPVSTTPAPTSFAALSLPEPIISGNSVEICLNSRYSEHRLTGTAGNQQIANVLWAAGKAPFDGVKRDIVVTTPEGQFEYNSASGALIRRSDRKVSGGAFVIDCESELPFDTGVAYMTAITASVGDFEASLPCR